MYLEDVEKLAKEMTELCLQPVDEARLASPERQAILAAVKAAILHGKPKKPTSVSKVPLAKSAAQGEVSELAKEMTEFCMQRIANRTERSPAEREAILAALTEATLYGRHRKPAPSGESEKRE